MDFDQMAPAERERLLNKLARLKALSECKTGNPNETATAAAAMARLMLEYKIETAELEPQARPGDVEDVPLDHQRTQPYPIWQSHLLHCLATANDCVSYQSTTRHWSEADGKQKTTRLHLLGRRQDLDNTRKLFSYCLQEIERLSQRWKPGRGKRLRGDFRIGVAEAIAQMVQEEAEAVRAEAERRAQEDAQTSRALALLDRNLAEVEAAARQIGVREVRSRKQPNISPEAYQAGFRAGQNVVLPT
jgi:hypothetical protein